MPISATPYEHDHENEVVLFGTTNFRNQMRKFGIKTDDRRRHTYVIGKTGMGKTTLLENMVLADVYAGHGLAYIDPHGDTAEKLLDFIPPHRINDVVYFNPADMEYPMGFNILETVDESQKHLVAAGLMGVFKKIWPDVWSSRMEYILLNTIMALLDFPGSTLLGINRLLSDEEFRGRVVSLIQDPVVKTFWVKEFAAFSEKYRTEAVAPLQNKVGQFLSATVIRNIVAQVKSTIDMRAIMDSRKIFIVNLSKGRIGEENSRLLGAMIITRLQLSAMERVDMPEKDRQDFYLYVDEFQNFATESFANILSEARKYRLALIVAHQYIEQLDELVRAAIFGNVGTIIAFRVGASDAVFMEQEFAPRFTPEDLVNLKKFEVYLKLMIDGASSEPFSANTLAPIAERTGAMEKVIKVSRERYTTPRKTIEEKVIRWSGFGTADTGQKFTTEDEDAEQAAIDAKIAELAASSPDVGEYAKPADGGGFGGAKKKKKPEFQVPCSVCGKISELTFEPDWSKPWYCKEHLEMKEKGMLPKGAGVTPPKPMGPKAAPVSAPPKIVVTPAPKPVAPTPKPAAPAPKPQAAQAPKPATPAAPKPIPAVESVAVPVPESSPMPKPAPASSSSAMPPVVAEAVVMEVPFVPATPTAVEPSAAVMTNGATDTPPAHAAAMPSSESAPSVTPVAATTAPAAQSEAPKPQQPAPMQAPKQQQPPQRQPQQQQQKKQGGPKAPPPKIKGAPQPKMSGANVPGMKAVSLGALPSRENVVPRERKGDTPRVDSYKAPHKVDPAGTAEAVAGIPATSHKPRIVVSGDSDDAAAEILATAEKPFEQRLADAAAKSSSATPGEMPAQKPAATPFAPAAAPEPFTESPKATKPRDIEVIERSEMKSADMHTPASTAAPAPKPAQPAPAPAPMPEPKPPVTPPAPPAPSPAPVPAVPPEPPAPAAMTPPPAPQPPTQSSTASDQPEKWPPPPKDGDDTGVWKPGQVIKF